MALFGQFALDPYPTLEMSSKTISYSLKYSVKLTMFLQDNGVKYDTNS